MWILFACRGSDPVSPHDGPPPPDLTAALGPDEARAGVIVDPTSAWGGLAAEATVGDIKLYNDRARFAVQGVRDGSFYVVEGGGVIDADIVRAEGEPGRDLVDEWASMFGFGRITSPTAIEVVSDGTDGGDAVVRVVGTDVGLSVFEGALESPGIVLALGLTVETEYRLAPGSPLLSVTNTLTAPQDTVLAVGDVLFSGPERADRWNEGTGMGDDDGGDRRWSGYLGSDNDLAVAVVAGAGQTVSSAGYELITELAEMVVAMGPDVTLQAGVPYTQTRWYGVAPDMATLTDAALAARGETVDTLSGTVTASDGPVQGARVAVVADGGAFTMAVTDAAGAWSADVPVGAVTETLAIGRGRGRFPDLPSGAAPYGPYAVASAQADTLASWSTGAVGGVVAEGRGVGTLAAPGTLVVRSGDGLPFTALVRFTGPDASVDGRLVTGRPNGYAAQAWARDGEVAFPVEPGTWSVLAHRGMRFDIDEVPATVAAGETVTVDVSLPAGFDHTDWLLGDPHSHASPSPDGETTMEMRLVTSAAAGVQVHFGTDHDHLADYRPLVPALGLSNVLATIVSDEVSSPVRGHMNIYPVEPVAGAPNGGAWAWWTTIPERTQDIVDALRAQHGDGFVLQSNHPLSGLPSAAGWSVGKIPKTDMWTPDLQAVEVLNGGGNDHVAFWYDAVPRGTLLSPVGVSDSHGPADGDLGFSATFFHAEGADVSSLDPTVVADAIRSGRTVATRCPLPLLSILPGSTVTGSATLDVEVRAAPWCVVDRVMLVENGVIGAPVAGTASTFALEPVADAVYAVVVEGDTPTPVTGSTPWALTGPIFVDVDGDGWEPPLSPFVLD